MKYKEKIIWLLDMMPENSLKELYTAAVYIFLRKEPD